MSSSTIPGKSGPDNRGKVENTAFLGASVEILDYLIDPAMIISKDYQILYMNNAVRHLYNINGDAPGRLCYEIAHHRDRPCHFYDEHCPVKDVFENNKGVRILRHVNCGNQEELHEITASPLFDKAGRVQSVIKMVRGLEYAGLLDKIESSEQRYKNLAASSPNGIVIIDSRGIVIDCNPAAENMFGWKPGSLVGHPATVLMPKRLRRQHEEGLLRAVRGKEYKYTGKTIELTGWREKKKEEFPITLSLSSWQDGEELFFSAIIVDSSKQRMLEKSLQVEKERLEETQANMRRQHRELKGVFKQVEKAKEEWERTMDCIGDMVILVSPRDRILRCNKAVPEFFGLAYEQLLGKNWEDILLGHGMQTNYARGKAIELLHGPTGKWFLLNIYEYGKDKHDATKFVITLHETTRLKHIASELGRKNAEIEENQKKLEGALEEISSLIEKVTEGQAVVRFEYPSAGNCWEMMNCQQTGCPCYGRKSRRCWEEADAFCHEGLCQAGDDNKCTQCSFYQKANGDPIYQIGNQFNNMMDILETKNRELGDAYKELKATQAQILQQEKMASIGQLAAGVAHELNNPLGFISSNLSTLQKYLGRLLEFIAAQSQLIKVDDQGSVSEARSRLKIDYILEDTVNLIKESLEGADRLKKIIQDLKSFSRVDQANFTHANIIECIESTVNIVWNELKYKANVIKDYGELPLTKCYPQQLNQVFMNLLVNASQAIEKQGEIGIKAWCEHDFIYVAISDTGYGIPQENIKRIFEPFFTTKEVGKGTGLGLSITFDIIKKHHGEISVESEVGKGTTFTVKIPVVEGR